MSGDTQSRYFLNAYQIHAYEKLFLYMKEQFHASIVF